ncbi:hypothetical protein ACIOGT_25780 [Streptomyces microflavus]
MTTNTRTIRRLLRAAMFHAIRGLAYGLGLAVASGIVWAAHNFI